MIGGDTSFLGGLLVRVECVRCDLNLRNGRRHKMSGVECLDCGQQIKHVGDGVWIDHTQGDCCFETNEVHRPKKIKGEEHESPSST